MSTEIDRPYALDDGAAAAFARDGFVKLTSVFPEDALEAVAPAITREVDARRPNTPIEERTTYQRAFVQVTNLWRLSPEIERFVMGRRLGRIACEILGTESVRLYHDQALYKEPGGGHTPWHADQYYWPLASPKVCTAWIPLQETPLDMGPIAFSVGSHQVAFGRDLPISDESEERLRAALRGRPVFEEPFALGDVTFHRGWTFHRARGNETQSPRRVMTIIYMDGAMRLKWPENENQRIDREAWCPGTEVGEVIDTPLNPIVYRR